MHVHPLIVLALGVLVGVGLVVTLAAASAFATDDQTWRVPT